jgi:hypothetical protein
MHGPTIEPLLKPVGEQRLHYKTRAHQPATPSTSFDQTFRGNLEGAYESNFSHKGQVQTPEHVQSSPSLEPLPSSRAACSSHQTNASNDISLSQADETVTRQSKTSKDPAKKANDLLRSEQDVFPHINASAAPPPSDNLIALADANNQLTGLSGKQVVGSIPADHEGGVSLRASDPKQALKSNQDLNAHNPKLSGKLDRTPERPSHGFDIFTSTHRDRRANPQLLTQSKENIPHAKPSQALNPNQAQVHEEAPVLPHFGKLANSPDSISSSFDKNVGDRTKQPGIESNHIQNNSTASVWEAREWAKARNTLRRPGGKKLLVSSGEVSRREITAQDKRGGIENEKKVSRRKSAKTTFASAFQLTSRTNSSTITADGMPPAETRGDRAEPHTMRHDSSHNHKTMESMNPQPFDKLDVENHASKQERETYPLNRFKLGETEAGKRPASTGEAKSEIIATRSDLTTHGTIIPRTRLDGLNLPQPGASTIQRLENIIQDQVKVLNSASSKTLSVAVKPDTGLAMTLTLQQVDQQILVSARMDEHTANLLKPQWAELQKELESQGIRLNHQDSDQPFQSKHQHTRDESMSQDNGEKWSKQTQYRDQSSKHSEKPTQVKTKNSHTTLDASPEEHLYYA